MRRAVLCLAAALAPAWATACSQSTEPPRDVVLARVGVAARAAVAQPEQTSKPRRLGTHTRNALRATAEGFEAEVPAGATRLAFSHAVAGASGESVRFEIAVRTGAEPSWQTLYDLPVNEAAWRDVELPLLPTGGARRLRFRARAEDRARDPLWGSILLLGPGVAPAMPPDLLLVSLDTLGADYLGAYSGRRDVSPHLDAFLAESAWFRRAYAQYGNTLVSHASLFSALYPRHHGVRGGLAAKLQSSLVEALAGAGYRTVAFTEGGFVSAAFGFGRGFDAYDDGTLDLAGKAERGAAETFELAANWLEAYPRDRAFVFAHSYEVHSPYLPRDEAARAVAARSTPDDARLFSREEQTRQHTVQARHGLPAADYARLAALYLAEVHTLDAAVGRLLARLRALGRDETTLVVMTADHGEQFGEWGRIGHGQSLHNRVLHVPLALRWTGVIQPAVLDTPVMLVDVMPTVLQLLSIEQPSAVDGRSLLPLLTGEPVSARPAFSEQGNDDVECAQPGGSAWCRNVDRVALQTGRWKLVSSGQPAWTRLYDLERDPGEERDVAPEHPDEVRRLLALVSAYRESKERSAPGAAPAVDADTLERLRDLGYLEEPGAAP